MTPRAAAAADRIVARSSEDILASLLEAVASLPDQPGGVYEILVTIQNGRIRDLHRRRPKERIG